MAGPVTITCPVCGQQFEVPTEVVGIDHLRHEVLVRMDRSGLYGHLSECAAEHPDPAEAEPTHSTELTQVARQAEWPADPELAGRIGQLLERHAFVEAKGSRACTMCGDHGTACLKRLRRKKGPCCAACGVGNTHPAHGENAGSCAEWGAEHGATD